MKKKIFTGFFCLFFGGISAFGTVITVPEDASPVEKKAAEELSFYFSRMYGKKFPVKTGKQGRIFIGRTAPACDNELGNDGFEIISDGKNLLIRGGTREGVGCRFGVFRYLEKQGCRFFTAAEEYIPRKKKFETVSLKLREKPDFDLLRLVISAGRFGTKMWANSASNGFSTKGLGLKVRPENGVRSEYLPHNSHTMFYFMPPEKYAKKHPEYYAVHKGRRAFGLTTGELCFSNREMTAEFIRNCRKYLKRNYRKGMILVLTPQDNQNYCECSRCAEINKEEKTNGGTLVRFINQVASALEKEYPSLLIKANAYQYHRFPPAKTKYHPRVAIALANIECDYAKAFSGAPENEAFLKLLKQWKARCSTLFFLDYGSTFDNYLLPLPNFDALAERLRICRALGVRGVSIISTHTEMVGEFHELRNYLIGRLFWNADADPWAITDDFCRHYYGRGGSHIADYIRFYHRDLKKKKATFYGSGQKEHLYDKAFVDKAEEYFRKAYAESGKNPYYKLRLDKSYMTVRMMRLLLLKRTAVGTPEFFQALEALKKSFARFKLTRMAEHKTLALFLREISFVLKEVPAFCKGKKWIAAPPAIRTSNGWAKWGKDASASNERVGRLATFHNAWAVYYRTNSLPGYNSPIRYDVYVRIKVIPAGKAVPETPAVFAWASLAEKNIYTKCYTLEKCQPGKWFYLRVADNIPVTANGSVGLAPMKNPGKIKEILVDHFIFVRRDSL